MSKGDVIGTDGIDGDHNIHIQYASVFRQFYWKTRWIILWESTTLCESEILVVFVANTWQHLPHLHIAHVQLEDNTTA